jgi:KDO2-lipid IV(A) lauroyltransferase
MKKVALVVDNSAAMSEEDLIKSYFAKLERDIKELPEYWLWSHKRWKHKRIKSDTTNL